MCCTRTRFSRLGRRWTWAGLGKRNEFRLYGLTPAPQDVTVPVLNYSSTTFTRSAWFVCEIPKKQRNVLLKVVAALRSSLLPWLNLAAGSVRGACEFWSCCAASWLLASCLPEYTNIRLSGSKDAASLCQRVNAVWPRNGESAVRGAKWGNVVKRGTILWLLPIPNIAPKKQQ